MNKLKKKDIIITFFFVENYDKKVKTKYCYVLWKKINKINVRKKFFKFFFYLFLKIRGNWDTSGHRALMDRVFSCQTL
jgi:hypothetical protein